MNELGEFDYEKLDEILDAKGIIKRWLASKVGVRSTYYNDMKRLKKQPSKPVWIATAYFLSIPPETFAKSN